MESRIKLHNPGGSKEQPSMPPGYLQVYGAGWDPPESTEGAGGRGDQATLRHLSAVLANRGDPRGLEDRQCKTHLQEGPEGVSQELQASQPDLGARQDYGAVHLECAHWACDLIALYN